MRFLSSIFLSIFMATTIASFDARAERIEEESQSCAEGSEGQNPSSLNFDPNIMQASFFGAWDCNDATAQWVSTGGIRFHYDRLGSPNSHGECRRRAVLCGHRYYSSTTYSRGNWNIHGCIGFD